MIGATSYLVCLWVFAGVATLTSTLRLVIEKSRVGKRWDVVLMSTSSFLFLANVALLTAFTSSFYYLIRLEPHSARQRLSQSFFRLQFATTSIAVTCLWLIKLSIFTSFLSFLDTVRTIRNGWWLGVCSIAVSWAICVIGYPIVRSPCLIYCTDPGFSVSYGLMWMQICFDIATDCLIIIVPLVVLLSARVSWHRGLFPTLRIGIIIFTMATSVARGAASYIDNGLARLFWLNFLTSLQCCVSLLVCNSLSVDSFLRNKRRLGTKGKAVKTVEQITEELPTQHIPPENTQASDLLQQPASDRSIQQVEHYSKPLPEIPQAVDSPHGGISLEGEAFPESPQAVEMSEAKLQGACFGLGTRVVSQFSWSSEDE